MIRLRSASEISLEISICNVAVRIVATGLSETMYVFVSAEVWHGISTKATSVFSATAGTEVFPFISSYMVSDKPVATIRTATLQIDISNEISDALLTRSIREVSHA